MTNINLETNLELANILNNVSDLNDALREIARCAYIYEHRDEPNIRCRVRELCNTICRNVCTITNTSNSLNKTVISAYMGAKNKEDLEDNFRLDILVPASGYLRDISKELRGISKKKELINRSLENGVDSLLYGSLHLTVTVIDIVITNLERYIDDISSDVDRRLRDTSIKLKYSSEYFSKAIQNAPSDANRIEE